MSSPAILFGGYIVVGIVVAAVIAMTDFSKKRTSIAGIFGDIAGFHAIGFLLFLALWPIWLGLLLFAGEDEREGSQSNGSHASSPQSTTSKNEEA